jgi:pullulanase
MKPLLENKAIKPTVTEIRYVRDGFIDLLNIRASSSLFRMHSAKEIRERLKFHNVGPTQNPAVIVAEIDGKNYPGGQFNKIVYVVNASASAASLTVDALKSPNKWKMHPVIEGGQLSSTRKWMQNDVTLDAATGAIKVAPRSVGVFVQ